MDSITPHCDESGSSPLSQQAQSLFLIVPPRLMEEARRVFAGSNVVLIEQQQIPVGED